MILEQHVRDQTLVLKNPIMTLLAGLLHNVRLTLEFTEYLAKISK